VLLDVDDMGSREGRLVEHMAEVAREVVTAGMSQRPGEINRKRDSFKGEIRSAER
jgi:hypothetical protein